MVQGNGMDLSLFQFDYDMSFAVTFIDADRNVLGRYGTRTKRPDAADSEISIQGLLASMKAVVDIKKHPNFPRGVVGKTGQKQKIATPEEHPLLAPKYDSNITYGNNVAKSCIHCHQIRDVERKEIRAAGQPIPDQSLFPYPMPSLLGLQFDKDTRATISEVTKDSVAHVAGIEAGDEIFLLENQFIVSVADIQWILHNAPDEGTLTAILKSKDGKPKSLGLPIRKGWRKTSDISWRTSTWDLRRMSFGGMKLDLLPDEERQRHGIAEGNMALLAVHVGQYN
jgi:serine protease Do